MLVFLAPAGKIRCVCQKPDGGWLSTYKLHILPSPQLLLIEGKRVLKCQENQHFFPLQLDSHCKALRPLVAKKRCQSNSAFTLFFSACCWASNGCLIFAFPHFVTTNPTYLQKTALSLVDSIVFQLVCNFTKFVRNAFDVH